MPWFRVLHVLKCHFLRCVHNFQLCTITASSDWEQQPIQRQITRQLIVHILVSILLQSWERFVFDWKENFVCRSGRFEWGILEEFEYFQNCGLRGTKSIFFMSFVNQLTMLYQCEMSLVIINRYTLVSRSERTNIHISCSK